MPQKRNYRKRRQFNLRRVRVQSELAVGALAGDDVVSGAMIVASVGTYRLMSIKCAWSLTDLGAASDDGFQFGVAHSDYSAAEIEECLEAQAAIDLGNKTLQEQSNRLVRVIGVINNSGGSIAGAGLAFKNGIPVKTKLNWLMTIGDTLSVWVRNASGATYTTGALLGMIGDLWLKDSV